MRSLWIVTVMLALAAAYFEFGRRTSYSAYSDAQLTELAQGYRAEMERPRGQVEDAAVSLSLVDDERLRRGVTPVLWLSGGLVLLLNLLLMWFRRTRAPAMTGDDARLRMAIGDPSVIEAGARHKAAALLAVSVDAPREVVLAAYEAQRRLSDPGSLEGFAPDLRRIVQERLVALEKARQLLAQPPAGP